MLKINFVTIFFLFLFILIDAIDEDLFDDLWKNLKPPTPKNSIKQKLAENYSIKEEIVDNNESLEKHSNNLKIKIKEPKIELEQLSAESSENEFDEQTDQNVSFVDQSNSADDEDYSDLKKLEQIPMKAEENEETKREVIRKFDQLRKENCGFKYDKKNKCKMERKIANKLGINRKKIYKWKRELKKEISIRTKFSTQQQVEKIKQFEKVKKEFTEKFNLKSNRKINEKIAEKIGILLRTIYYWKTKFDFKRRKINIYSDAEKLKYVKRSEEMVERNPMISETKIAEKLGIPCANLRRWKKKFGTKLNR